MNDKKPSRRDFLRGTTAAAAGVALAGGLNVARTAHASGSDQLKIALVGCGGRGRGAVMNCLQSCDNVKLVALADAFEDNAKISLKLLRKEEKIAAKIDVPQDRIFFGFDAYRQALATDPDVVFLATPPGFRPIHYAAAVAAGKHVFMEKPCCVDASGFRSFMETNRLADEKGLKVVVGLQRRYSRPFIEKVKRIQDGAIGDPMLMRAYWNCGPIWVRKRKPNQNEMEYQMNNWYHFVWLCGDHIVEQHVHNLDACNWVKDAHPVEANGMGSCHVRDNRGIGQIYDNHCVEFTYADGTKLYSQCRQQPNTWEQVTQFIHGAKGVMELHCRAADDERTSSDGHGSDGYDLEQIALIDAIRNGTKRNDGWYGATSTFTGILGRMATYSGKLVKWDEAVAGGPDEMPKRFAFDADPPAMPDADGNYPMPVPGLYKPYRT
ncbi:MAG: Gfo/Idh/MocA family oxidoreductase [Pirellulales bacterium]|nr:Gfo/Idh/MocA family oxidoreductase [Pirellulales bacterium]